jgi:TonB family protein
METIMQTSKPVNSALLVSLIVVLAGPVPLAQASYFQNLNVGSAPNPRANDVIYPTDARLRGEQGEVALSVLLFEDGTVSSAVVEKTSGSQRLDDAAVRYVKAHWSYAPPEGEKMPTETRVSVKFELQ